MRTRWLALLAPLLGLAACGSDATEAPVVSDVAAQISAEMGTVVEVTWRTDIPTQGAIEFGEDDRYGRITSRETAPTKNHSALLVGCPQDVDIQFRVLSDGAPDDQTHTVSTGTLDGAPELDVEGEQDLFLTLPIVTDDLTQITVVDPKGRVVWLHEDTRQTSVFRARVARDGSGIVYAATVYRGEPHQGSAIVRVPWDGSAATVIDIPWLAHDFVELDDGTLVSLSYEYRDDIQGNKLIQIDPDGTVTDLWSAWDCFDPETHISSDPDHGWIHANALDYDASTDSFLVGMRNLSSIVRVDRGTGECVWTLGRGAGDVEQSGGTFVHQHQFGWFGDRFLVFDNDGAPGLESRVLEYDFDEATGTAQVARTIVGETPIFSLILGDVHRLDDGDTVVVWSAAALAERVAEDDSRSWSISGPDGSIFGFTEPWTDPGRPDLGPHFP
jgi:hypothetical protein